jgi:predicted ATP-grasp superfamily ATP-dependent carboligase
MHFGNSSIVEPIEDCETDSLCDQFLKRMRYAGLCEIALKRDCRDGRVKLVEVNPRYTGISNAAPYAGIDLGWLHYLDLIGQRVEVVSQDDRKFRHICLSWDIAAIRDYRRAGLLTWRDVIRPYRPPLAFYDIDFRNWRVTLGTFVNIAKLVVGRPIRRLLSRKQPV